MMARIVVSTLGYYMSCASHNIGTRSRRYRTDDSGYEGGSGAGRIRRYARGGTVPIGQSSGRSTGQEGGEEAEAGRRGR